MLPNLDTPNSCSKSDSRKLPLCDHVCALICHPGTCMSCTTCPPDQSPVARSPRARLSQSGPIRDLERDHRGPGDSNAPSFTSHIPQSPQTYDGPWRRAIASISSFSKVPLSISCYSFYPMLRRRRNVQQTLCCSRKPWRLWLVFCFLLALEEQSAHT